MQVLAASHAAPKIETMAPSATNRIAYGVPRLSWLQGAPHAARVQQALTVYEQGSCSGAVLHKEDTHVDLRAGDFVEYVRPSWNYQHCETRVGLIVGFAYSRGGPPRTPLALEWRDGGFHFAQRRGGFIKPLGRASLGETHSDEDGAHIVRVIPPPEGATLAAAAQAVGFQSAHELGWDLPTAQGTHAAGSPRAQ